MLSWLAALPLVLLLTACASTVRVPQASEGFAYRDDPHPQKVWVPEGFTFPGPGALVAAGPTAAGPTRRSRRRTSAVARWTWWTSSRATAPRAEPDAEDRWRSVRRAPGQRGQHRNRDAPHSGGGPARCPDHLSARAFQHHLLLC